MYTQHGGFLAPGVVEVFDPKFFGMSAAEAQAASPAQRLLLELAVRALGTADFHSQQVAVCVGSCHHDWERLQCKQEGSLGTPYSTTGVATSVLAGWVALLGAAH